MRANFKFAAPLMGAAAIAMVAMPSFAADAIYEQPPEPAPVEIVPSASTGWAGGYVGIQGGYDWAETDSNISGTRDHDGWNIGGFAGWQGQAGNIVYGAEIDAGYNDASGAAGGLATRGGAEGSLRARLGYAVNDRFMVYATGGGAAARLTATDGIAEDTNTMLGYTVGAGAEAKVTENVFLRGEYRFTDYGNETFNLGAGPESIDQQSNKVVVGIGYKF